MTIGEAYEKTKEILENKNPQLIPFEPTIKEILEAYLVLYKNHETLYDLYSDTRET